MKEVPLRPTSPAAGAGEISGAAGRPPCIALLPWGDLIEDFLDTIGVSFESFRDEMTGGWLFGYVEALRRAGVRAALFCVSARTAAPRRYVHGPTGAPLWVLPVPAAFLAIRRRMRAAYGYSVEDTFGPRGRRRARGLARLAVPGLDRLRRGALAVLRDVAPYLATPPVALARALRSEGCQAILCQEYEYPRFDACVAVGRVLGRPVFATFQGGDTQISRLERPLRPVTLRACAGLIVATGTEARRLETRYGIPGHRVARIFNPLDLSLWGPGDGSAARAALGIPPDAAVVAWHGRVDLRRKGIDVLLEAWDVVCRRRQGRELRLLLVGTGPDAGELRRRIDEGGLRGVLRVDDYVLDRGAMRQYLAAADVYAFPSRHEGFPVAPVEAMACGLPLVAADAPGVPDILEGGEQAGGLVVPREDPAALAAALGGLLDDPPLARELGRRARRTAEERFSIDAVGEQLRAFLAARGAFDEGLP